jgi:hypothetical protein
MIEVWRQHKITFGNREQVITDSAEFSFDMGNIARLRREMKVLIQGLSKLHHPLAENQRRLELAASKLKASKKKSTPAPPSTASSDDTPLAIDAGAPPSGASSGGQPSTDVAAGVTAEADSALPLPPPVQSPPESGFIPTEQSLSSDAIAPVTSSSTNCGSLDPTYRRARLTQAFDRLAALYFPQRRLAVAYLPHTLSFAAAAISRDEHSFLQEQTAVSEHDAALLPLSDYHRNLIRQEMHSYLLHLHKATDISTGLPLIIPAQIKSIQSTFNSDLNIGRKFFHIARNDFGLLSKAGHLSENNVSAHSILDDDHWLWVSLRHRVGADATLHHLSQYNALWTRIRNLIDTSSLLTYQDLVAVLNRHNSAIITVDDKPCSVAELCSPVWPPDLTPPSLPKDSSLDDDSQVSSGSGSDDSSFAGNKKKVKSVSRRSPRRRGSPRRQRAPVQTTPRSPPSAGSRTDSPPAAPAGAKDADQESQLSLPADGVCDPDPLASSDALLDVPADSVLCQKPPTETAELPPDQEPGGDAAPSAEASAKDADKESKLSQSADGVHDPDLLSTTDACPDRLGDSGLGEKPPTETAMVPPDQDLGGDSEASAEFSAKDADKDSQLSQPADGKRVPDLLAFQQHAVTDKVSIAVHEQDGPPLGIPEASENSVPDAAQALSPKPVCMRDTQSLASIDALIDRHGDVAFCQKLRIGKKKLTVLDQALLARLLTEAVDGSSHDGDQ